MFKSTPKTQKKRKNAERLRSIEEAKKRKMAELEQLEKLKEKLEASDDDIEGEASEFNEEYEISEKGDDSTTNEENELSMHIANMSTIIANQEKQVSKFIARQAVAKELPDFNGDPEEWPLFYAMFQQSSKDGDFTATENTMRLAKALKGDARDRVKTLIATAAAPEDIINVLQSHFGHPRQVINRMMARIASTPDPKDGDPESIVKFATIVENLSFGLKWLDKGRYMDSPWVTNDIERKLSPTMRMLWAMRAKEIPNYSVTDLATWLNDQSKISLNILPVTSLSTQSSTGNKQKTKEHTRTPKIRSAAVMTTQIATKSYKCAVCEEGHYTNECPKLKESTVKERYKLAKGLCWGCLGRNHRLNTCVRRRTCGLDGCKRMHHRLLHGTEKSVKFEDEKKEDNDKTDTNTKVSNNLKNMEIPVDVTDPSGRKLLTMEGLFSKISGEAEESCSSKGTLTGGDDGVLFGIPITNTSQGTTTEIVSSDEKTSGVSLFGASNSGKRMFNEKNENTQTSSESCAKDQNHIQEISLVEFQSKGRHTAFAGASQCQATVMLRVLPVEIAAPDKSNIVRILALLDSASSVSLIDGTLIRRLGVFGTQASMELMWLDGSSKEIHSTTEVTLAIRGVFPGAKWYELRNIRTMSDLILPEVRVDKEKLINQFPYLKTIEFSGFSNQAPQILLGEDNAFLIATHDLIHGPLKDPVASKTALGWVISGSDGGRRRHPEYTHMSRNSNKSEIHELTEIIKTSFSTEDFGVKVYIEKPRSQEDKYALSIMESTTKRVGQRFETGLLWKDTDAPLPQSRATAWRRLRQIEMRMDRDEAFKTDYTKKFEHYIDSGYLEPVESPSEQSRKVWYLPHFGVTNPNKPGKLRLVYDAAAKAHGISLNDCLLKGPDLMNNLPGILLQFRKGQYAFAGDIQEMFHQIVIREQDRDAQRVLWRADKRDVFPQEYRMRVMTFGVACSPALAAYVKDKNAKEFINRYPTAVDEIIRKHFVDDYLGCTDDEESAIQLINEVINIHKQGGFNIRNFISNSQKILSGLPKESCRDIHDKDLDIESSFEKILGVWWNTETDCFTFKVKINCIQQEVIEGTDLPTKREALRILMSIFDPLGMFAHFIICGKILLQKIWKRGIEWDDELPSDLGDEWRNWLKQLSFLPRVSIPRCYSDLRFRTASVELHVFADASSEAFASVAYLRFVKNGHIHVSFVMARTRVEPIKGLTIPKLELQAALMASRLSKTIEQYIDITVHRKVFWSDSMVVLGQIRGDPLRRNAFVANRVGEINELTNPETWRYVPSQLNVADQATRGNGMVEFSATSTWYQGPIFLWKDENLWPAAPGTRDTKIDENEDELDFETINVVTLDQPTASDDDRLHESVLDPENYMRWDHMLKVAGYVYKFIDACRQRRRTNNLIEPNGKIFLTASDYKGGERCIIRQTQQECFHAEFECLAQSRTLENHENNRHVNAKLSKKSTIYKLNPGLDENGIIRAYGRIQMMPRASEDFKNPILLHAGNRAVQLMLTHYHQELGHWGTPLVMAELRQRFEIITGRKALKQIQMDCITCQKARSQPNVPIMGQIPEERLSAHVHPFTHTGCDFFGPLYVKTGRSEVKRYGAIFTCLTTRAIHLELCENLTTDSCILAIRRFMARRGEPETILSDNGTNFKGAEREIRQSLAEIKHDVITSTLAKRQVTWKFNPPHAPHMGGTWERLVAPVKKAISLAIGSSKHPPSQEVLQTVLAEAEHLVNSRPLAEVSDANEVLTPNHFLIHRQSGLQAPGTFTDQDLVLRKEWRKSQRLTDIFWKKWLQFYTPTLTHRPKWHSNNPNVKVGDRVMIVDPNLERNTWPVGRVVELYPGKDGKVRVVLVRTEDEHKVFKRPVAKLIILRTPKLLNDELKPKDRPNSGGDHVECRS